MRCAVDDAKPGWKITKLGGDEIKNFEAINVDDIFDPFTQKMVFEPTKVTRQISQFALVP